MDADYRLDNFDDPELFKAKCEATNTNEVEPGIKGDGLDIRKV